MPSEPIKMESVL